MPFIYLKRQRECSRPRVQYLHRKISLGLRSSLRMNPARDKYLEEMEKLEKFMSKVQPYNCKKEQFKDIKAIMHELRIELNEATQEIKQHRKLSGKRDHQLQAKQEQIVDLQKQLGCFDGSTRKEKM